MITWGIVASAIGFTQGAHSFYVLRFLLGAAEAGFFPGVVYYMTLWYPAGHRAKPYALFMSFSVMAYILVGPLSTWLMTISNGILGHPGWRWLFVLEGVPCVVLGFVTLFYLTDYPAKAKWLTTEEKAWLQGTLDTERRAAPPVEHHSLGSFLSDKRLWVMAGVYFWWNLGNLGLLFWLPTILKSGSKMWSNQTIGFLYAVPYICSFIGIYVITWYTRRTGDRRGALLFCSVVPFLALTVSAWVTSTVFSYAMVCVAAFCYMAVLPIFWTLPAEYLGGKTAAGGIAFISSTTGIGGLLGPWLVGLIKDATGKFQWSVEALAVAFLLQGCFIVAMKIKKGKVSQPQLGAEGIH
jgi:MFS family permease